MVWEMIRDKTIGEGEFVCTGFQTAGKGQPGNSWESERDKNLLFSMYLVPRHIPASEIFLVSQLVSLGIKAALDQFTDGISIKWPNDIYWNDKKIGGILIENSLQGNIVNAVVIGIGLNINQQDFKSNAPNPVSLLQITHNEYTIEEILQQVWENIMQLYTEAKPDEIRWKYAENLYRRHGFHSYKSDKDIFNAKIIGVQPDGRLMLETDAGVRKQFYFKEVQFVF